MRVTLILSVVVFVYHCSVHMVVIGDLFLNLIFRPQLVYFCLQFKLVLFLSRYLDYIATIGRVLQSYHIGLLLNSADRVFATTNSWCHSCTLPSFMCLLSLSKVGISLSFNLFLLLKSCRLLTSVEGTNHIDSTTTI